MGCKNCGANQITNGKLSPKKSTSIGDSVIQRSMINSQYIDKFISVKIGGKEQRVPVNDYFAKVIAELKKYKIYDFKNGRIFDFNIEESIDDDEIDYSIGKVKNTLDKKFTYLKAIVIESCTAIEVNFPNIVESRSFEDGLTKSIDKFHSSIEGFFISKLYLNGAKEAYYKELTADIPISEKNPDLDYKYRNQRLEIHKKYRDDCSERLASAQASVKNLENEFINNIQTYINFIQTRILSKISEGKDV